MTGTAAAVRRTGGLADGSHSPPVRLSDRPTPILDVRAYSFWYGATQALFAVTVTIPRRAVTALIGPSSRMCRFCSRHTR